MSDVDLLFPLLIDECVTHAAVIYLLASLPALALPFSEAIDNFPTCGCLPISIRTTAGYRENTFRKKNTRLLMLINAHFPLKYFSIT